jgi:hypothetical protein
MSDDSRKFCVGDIVQIYPEHDKTFGGCLMIVTEVYGWGAEGYFDVPARALRIIVASIGTWCLLVESSGYSL